MIRNRSNTTSTTPSLPSRRWLYVNDFTWVTDAVKRAAFIAFCLAKKFNALAFYDLSSVCGSGAGRTAFAAFLGECDAAGLTLRTGVGQTNDGLINLANNASRAYFNANYSPKLQGITREWEFWKSNPNGNFAAFMAESNTASTYCIANNLLHIIYLARCKDVAGAYTPEQVADYVVATFDEVNLVNYCNEVKYIENGGISPGYLAQLVLLGDAARRAGKVVKINVLVASQGNVVDGVPTNLGTYFASHSNYWDFMTLFASKYNAIEVKNAAGTNLKPYINANGGDIYGLAGLITI